MDHPIRYDNSRALGILCSFMAGVILTGATSYLAYPHNLATKDDVTASQQSTQKEVESLQTQTTLEQDEITAIRISMGEVKEKLRIGDK